MKIHFSTTPRNNPKDIRQTPHTHNASWPETAVPDAKNGDKYLTVITCMQTGFHNFSQLMHALSKVIV